MQYDPIEANQPILAEIAEFCAIAGLSETKLGKLALNDTAFVHAIRRGRQPTQRTLAILRAFMASKRAAKQEGAAQP